MWVKKWDAAQEKWVKETPSQPQKAPKESSFFGLQRNDVPDEASVSDQEGSAWRGIYDRAADIRPEAPDEDQIFHEQAQGWRKLLGESSKKNPQQQPGKKSSFHEQAEGWRNLIGPAGKGTTFFQHPQHHTSVGMDQGHGPYEPTRVAPNFTDGTELRKLNDLKVKLEKLESTLLSQEIKAGKANVPASDYKSQLDALRRKIDALSDKLTPEPGKDVH
jgi:hypothetical protein